MTPWLNLIFSQLVHYARVFIKKTLAGDKSTVFNV